MTSFFVNLFFSLFSFVFRAFFRTVFSLLRFAFKKRLSPGEARIVRIIDGDTVFAEFRGKRERVRLLGIDAPESRENDRLFVQARKAGVSPSSVLSAGRASTKFLLSLVRPGDVVRLEFDDTLRDKYGRLLAYVWKNEILVNEKMVEAGHAVPCFFGRNRKYSGRIVSAA